MARSTKYVQDVRYTCQVRYLTVATLPLPEHGITRNELVPALPRDLIFTDSGDFT
jgi:hypothetical protein